MASKKRSRAQNAAIYQRRKARGVAQGLSPSEAAGHQKRQQAAAARIARRTRARRPKKKVERQIGDFGRTVESSSPVRLLLALRQAVERGELVSLYLTFNTYAGYLVRVIPSREDKYPKGWGRIAPRPAKPVLLVFDGERSEGVDPQSVLDLIDREGSTWGAWRELFDFGEVAL